MPYPTLDDLRDRIAAVRASDDPQAMASTYQMLFEVAIESGDPFRELIAGLPAEYWHGDPMIAAALGASYRAAGEPRGPAALAFLDIAQATIDASPDGVPVAVQATVLLCQSSAYRTLGRLVSAEEKLTELETLLETDPTAIMLVPLRARAALERASVALHMGELQRAANAAQYAHGFPTALSRSEEIENLGVLALIHYTQGEFDVALRAVREAREVDAPEEIFRSGFAAALHTAEMLVRIERREFDDLPDLEARMMAACHRNEYEPFSHTVSALSLAVTGHGVEALEKLRIARQGYRTWEKVGLGYDIGEVLRAAILIYVDQGEQAFEVLSAVDPRQNHATCPARYMAKVRLEHGDLIGARAVLADCDALGDDHSPRTIIDVWLLEAAIDHERGNLPASDLLFDRALLRMATIGSGYPLAILDSAVLTKLTRRAQRRSHRNPTVRLMISRILEANPQEVAAPSASTALTPRERLILGTVVRDLTVAQMAAELHISPNTVKTHLRRLYAKLGVSNRDEAIRMGRTLGLHFANAE